MVTVNKNIVPGNQAESSAKAEPQAPARRPRNTALNSSKKLPDSIKNRRKQKLNCSREQVIDQLVNEEEIYTQEEAEELVDSFEEQTGATVERLATEEEVDEKDGEFWATKDGRTTLWCRGNGMWYDSGISDEGAATDIPREDLQYTEYSVSEIRSLEDEMGYGRDELVELVRDGEKQIGAGFLGFTDDGYFVFEEDGKPVAYEQSHDRWFPVDSARKLNSSGKSGNDSSTGSSEELNCSDESAEDISLDKALEFLDAGNVPEIQNARVFDNDGRLMVLYPDSETGKYMLMEATVTGEPATGDEVMEDYLKSTGSLDSSKGSKSLNSSTDEETNLDDIKITTESGNEVSMQDIKIVQNPDTNELAIFIPEDEEETIPEGFSVIGMVVPDMVDSVPAIEGGEVCPECGQDPCVCESSEETEVEESEELDSSKKKTELTHSAAVTTGRMLPARLPYLRASRMTRFMTCTDG